MGAAGIPVGRVQGQGRTFRGVKSRFVAPASSLIAASRHNVVRCISRPVPSETPWPSIRAESAVLASRRYLHSRPLACCSS